MPAFARSLRMLWTAIVAGGLMALAVLTILAAVSDTHALADRADGAFYACALYSAAALGVAFVLMARMPERAAAAPSETAARAAVRGYGAAAIAAAESSAILAGAAVFLTGNVLVVAFGIPFAAFAAVTWPTDARVARWLGGRV